MMFALVSSNVGKPTNLYLFVQYTALENSNMLDWFQVVVPKAKGEILGVVIVESGWGSMLPTIVLANLLPTGPAARCGQLNIGDQV